MVPAAFFATTRKRYVVAGLRPLTVITTPFGTVRAFSVPPLIVLLPSWKLYLVDSPAGLMIALSFALVIPEAIFRAIGGHAAPVISVLMANTVTLSSLIAMYEAIVQFSGGPNRRWLLWAIRRLTP